MEYVGMIATAAIMDTLWLTANFSYNMKVFANLQGAPLTIRWIPSILVYILIIAAVWYFAVRDSKKLEEAALRGGLLGLSMYGLYDLTNYATLAKYPLAFMIADMAWGTVLCASIAAAGFSLRIRS